jgi:AcrR family transcriptional regulator
MIRVMLITARRYTNTWREQQAAQTRESILNAVIQVLAGGLADLSVPAIAREAGLSVRTIYRHFPTKRDLLIALGEHMDQHSRYQMEPLPRSPEDLAQTIRDAYRQADTLNPQIQAAYATGLGQEVRRERDMPIKLQVFAEALAPILGSLPPDEQRHLLHLVTVLISRYTLHRFKADLGVSADEAAETVVWALQTLTQALAGRPPADGRERKQVPSARGARVR